jgi:hypothetical protein
LIYRCRWVEEKLRDRGWPAGHDGNDHGVNLAEASGRVFSVAVGAGADKLAAVRVDHPAAEGRHQLPHPSNGAVALTDR